MPEYGGVQVAGDERDPNAAHGAHAEAAQHDGVAVAASDQDQVLQDRRAGSAGHAAAPAARASTRATPGSKRRGSGSRLSTTKASCGKSYR